MPRFLLAPLCAALPAVAGATDILVSWQPVAEYADGTPVAAGTAVTYNLYGALQGKPKQLLTAVPLADTSSRRSNVLAGVQCYEVTTVIDGVESDHSAESCASVIRRPKPPAGLNVAVQS